MKIILQLFAAAIISVPIFLEGCFCKTTRKISGALIKKDTTQVKAVNENTNIDSLLAIKNQIKQLKAHAITYKTLKAKAKVEYANTNEGVPDLNAYINIKHNHKIWIRIALPGTDFELYRVLITKDSVILLDNRKNTVFFRSFAYLQETTNLPFDFETIENLLAGNPISVPDSIIGFKYQNKELNVVGLTNYFKQRLTIDTSNNTMLNAKLDDRDPLKNRTCQITYSQYQQSENRLISMFRTIIVADKKTSQIKLTFKDIYFDKEDLNFNIKIPKKYKIK